MKTDPNESWHAFCNHMEEVWEKRNKLNREKCMIMTPTFREIPEYAHVMTLEDFIENVECGGFNDYDGNGRYVRNGKESDIGIYPSDIEHGSVRDDFDSVGWYNK